MADVGPYHRRSAPISTFIDFAVELGSVPLALAPALEQVIFVGIKLTGTKREWSRQRRFWRLPKVLADGIASYTKFFPNLAQAHPGRMQLLHPLRQFPFLQEACLRLALAGRRRRKRGQGVVLRLALPQRSFPIFQSNMRANQERFHGITQVRKDVPPIGHLCCLRGSTGGSIDIRLPTISTHRVHFWVCSQPLAHALCLAIRKQINNFVRLQVHENAAEALATSPTPIVNPDDAHVAYLRQRNQEERAEHGGL